MNVYRCVKDLKIKDDMEFKTGDIIVVSDSIILNKRTENQYFIDGTKGKIVLACLRTDYFKEITNIKRYYYCYDKDNNNLLEECNISDRECRIGSITCAECEKNIEYNDNENYIRCLKKPHGKSKLTPAEEFYNKWKGKRFYHSEYRPDPKWFEIIKIIGPEKIKVLIKYQDKPPREVIWHLHEDEIDGYVEYKEPAIKQEVLEKLKPLLGKYALKFRVTDEQSEELQKFLLTNGYRWINKSKTAMCFCGFLFLNQFITYEDNKDEDYFDNHKNIEFDLTTGELIQKEKKFRAFHDDEFNEAWELLTGKEYRHKDQSYGGIICRWKKNGNDQYINDWRLLSLFEYFEYYSEEQRKWMPIGKEE